jgi:hypothetical protein
MNICLKSCLVLAMCCMIIYAQAPDTAWTKTFGDTGFDLGYSVQQTSDNGYIITGQTAPLGVPLDNVFLIKTDSLGDTLWTKSIGATVHSERGYSVRQTLDGGYIIAGNKVTYEPDTFDILLIKTDSLGSTQWTKTYGGDSIDEAYSIQQTSDHGYIIAGCTRSYGAGNSDAYLIKTDSLGDTLWTKTFGGFSSDKAYSVQQTADDGYIITGTTYSFGAGEYDIYLIKTHFSGYPMWTKTIGGPESEGGNSVLQTVDHGYVVAGYTHSYGAGEDDVYLVKTDSLGDTLWTRVFGGAEYDNGFSVHQIADDGYIITGATNSFGAGAYDIYLIKTDPAGYPEWTKTIGGPDIDAGRSVQQTEDEGYIIVGYTRSYGAGEIDVYLIKIKSLTGIEENQDLISAEKTAICNTLIFAGPLILPENSKYEIFDISGREVLPEQMKPGVYFLRMDNRTVQKVVKVR